MRVHILHPETFEVLRSNVWLDDAIPDADERAAAENELRKTNRYWLGGGAAPLFYLIKTLKD
jgi:hypothetical protein